MVFTYLVPKTCGKIIIYEALGVSLFVHIMHFAWFNIIYKTFFIDARLRLVVHFAVLILFCGSHTRPVLSIIFFKLILGIVTIYNGI